MSDGYYAKSPADDPTRSCPGSYRVLRGGSWGSPAWYCRSAIHLSIKPGEPALRFGLPCLASSGGSRRAIVPSPESYCDERGDVTLTPTTVSGRICRQTILRPFTGVPRRSRYSARRSRRVTRCDKISVQLSLLCTAHYSRNSLLRKSLCRNVLRTEIQPQGRNRWLSLPCSHVLIT